MLRRYLKRATNGGSLIPNCSLSCWRRACEKVGSERNRSIGLPGIARKSRNTITVTTKIVMTPWTNRRPIYRPRDANLTHSPRRLYNPIHPICMFSAHEREATRKGMRDRGRNPRSVWSRGSPPGGAPPRPPQATRLSSLRGPSSVSSRRDDRAADPRPRRARGPQSASRSRGSVRSSPLA